MFTVNTLLAWKAQGVDTFCNLVGGNFSEPVFYLAFTRRGPVTIEDLCSAALKYDMKSKILDDYTFDLFGNNVGVESMFWGDTIIAFTRS